MEDSDLKVLLYRVYALAFEAGVNRGNHYDMQECWERQKYFFEDDIKKAATIDK